MSLSGMRCYGGDHNHSSLRAIIPEDPVGARCFLLGICLEDLFPVRPFEGSKFVRIQRGAAGWFQETLGILAAFRIFFCEGLFSISRRSASAWGVKISSCIGRYLAYLAKDPRLTDPF